MIELSIGVILGGLVSWLITHWYYQRSSANVPDWAKPLIEKLPDSPISLNRLVELYHEALESGDIEVDPWSGYVSCPNCGASSAHFETWEAVDHERDDLYRGRRCGKCGYEISGGEV